MLDEKPRNSAKNPLHAPWTIDRLLGSVPLTRFLSEIFGRLPWYRPTTESNSGLEFGSLLNWDSLNLLLGIQSCWSAENFKLVRENRQLPPESYSQRVGRRQPVFRPIPALVEQSMQQGATLVLNGLDGMHRPIADLLDSIESATASRGQANAYISEAGRPGFGIHYDAHDAFVLQLAGAKQWRLYANVVDQPDRPVPAAHLLRAQAEPMLHEWTLQPGDLLYVPAGFCHEAIAVDKQSLHLTLAFKQVTRLDMLHAATEYLFERRASLGHHQYDLHQGEAAILSHLRAVLADFETLLADPIAVSNITNTLKAAHRVRGGYRLPSSDTRHVS